MPKQNDITKKPLRVKFKGPKTDILVMDYVPHELLFLPEQKKWRASATIKVEYQPKEQEESIHRLYKDAVTKVVARKGLISPSGKGIERVGIGPRAAGGSKQVPIEDDLLLLVTKASEIIREHFQITLATAFTYLVTIAAQLAKPLLEAQRAARDSEYAELAEAMKKHLPSATDLSERMAFMFRRVLEPEMKEHLRTRGRLHGTGWFSGPSDFLKALQDVLADTKSKPTQLQVLNLLDRHPLCRAKPKGARNQSHTKLLRDWLHKAGLRSYQEAIERYYVGPGRGK